MRLLVITTANLWPSPGRPQAGIFWANVLWRLARLVRRVDVIVPVPCIPDAVLWLPPFARYRNLARRAVSRGVNVHRPRYLAMRALRHLWLQGRAFTAAAAPVAERIHSRQGTDVVIGYGFGVAAHAAHCTAARIGRPCVCWAIGTDVHTAPFRSHENAALLRHNVRGADVILTESEGLRQDLLQAVPGAGHIHTFYKGITLGRLRTPPDRTALRARLGMALDRRYLLMAGHVRATKGAGEFYDVFRRLAPARPDLDAVWIGEGPERQALEQRAAADGLAGRFTVSGYVKHPTVLDYMRAADLMLFTSHNEGLPNVVMEALGAGLPVVATDVGGVGEVVVDGATGRLVPARDVEAMTRRVAEAFNEADRTAAMALRGYEFIHRHFDVDRNVAVALQILEHVAAGGPGEAPLPPCDGVPPGELPAERVAAPD
jgi:glycosyltransferase involved in cell wall biosynthesis